MHNPLSKSRASDAKRGQSLIELAISFPIMLLLLLGTIDFWMALYSFLILRDAAQEGAVTWDVYTVFLASG